jgi:hypothetical protein
MSEFTEQNADQVHTFALQMSNLGLSRVTDLLLSMFQSGVWREFTDGTGTHRFLPGEFDYFLTQQGVTRDHVMHGIRDIKVKAQLEEAMDERRTGDANYRRRLADVRAEVPERPGSPIEPFGYSKKEGRLLSASGGTYAPARPPLGRAPRSFRLSGGVTTRRPNEEHGRMNRLTQALLRLDDDELTAVSEALAAEQSRRRKAKDAVTPSGFYVYETLEIP